MLNLAEIRKSNAYIMEKAKLDAEIKPKCFVCGKRFGVDQKYIIGYLSTLFAETPNPESFSMCLKCYRKYNGFKHES